MNSADTIIKFVLESRTPEAVRMSEAEEPEYIETRRELRPETFARLEANYREAFKREPEDGVGYSIGSRAYYLEGGKWYEEIRKKNPAYWDQPNYFIIYPGPDPHAFIAAKCPRRITQKVFQKAAFQVFKDATGLPPNRDNFGGVDGMDGSTVFDKCVNGARPELAYEIFLDGTWKRLKA